MIEIAIPNLEALEGAAKELVDHPEFEHKIAFAGDMGAGKTTFIQSLCGALGVEQVVNSPTFALINEYFTPDGDSIFHFDLYRIEREEELYDIGYEEYMYSEAYCFIEWPERAMALLPEDILHLEIMVMPDQSRLLRSVSA